MGTVAPFLMAENSWVSLGAYIYNPTWVSYFTLRSCNW